jgi:hypothetical protein
VPPASAIMLRCQLYVRPTRTTDPVCLCPAEFETGRRVTDAQEIESRIADAREAASFLQCVHCVGSLSCVRKRWATLRIRAPTDEVDAADLAVRAGAALCKEW